MKFINIPFLLFLVFPLHLLAKDSQIIDIGFITMLSGPGKVYGQVATNSAKLAIAQINENGINGKTIKLHIRDTNTAPATALSVTKALIRKNIDLMVGFHTSDERFAVKDYIQSQNKLYLYTAIYEGRDWGKWTFFTGPVPNQIYDQSIYHIAQKHQIKSVYLVGSDYSYARTSHEVLKKLLKQYDLELVGEKLYPFPTTHFDVDDIVAKNPDLIITNIVGEDDLLWALELQKNKLFMQKVKVFSGLLQDPLLQIIEPEFVSNFYSAYPFSRTFHDQTSLNYVSNYQKLYGNDFSSVGQGVYDSFLLLADALKKSNGQTDPNTLAKSLIGAQAKGPRGHNILESNHHVTMDIHLVQGNNDKKYHTIKTFKHVQPRPNN